MPDDLDDVLGAGRPRTSTDPRRLVLLGEISEEARIAASHKSRGSRLRWLMGTAAVGVLFVGTGAAAASPAGQQTLRQIGWISEPAPSPSPAVITADNEFQCTPQLEIAAGVSPTDASAQKSFTDGKAWLSQHPVTVSYALPPNDGATADAAPSAETNDGAAQRQAAETAKLQAARRAAQAQNQAQQATATTMSTQTPALQSGLASYLDSIGDNPSLVQLAGDQTNCEASGQ